MRFFFDWFTVLGQARKHGSSGICWFQETTVLIIDCRSHAANPDGSNRMDPPTLIWGILLLATRLLI